MFNNKSTTALYNLTGGNLFKCSNVSCHGRGNLIAMPRWKATTPTFSLSSCTNCHLTSTVAPSAYNGIYIGPFSGNNSMPKTVGVTTYNNLHDYHIRGGLGIGGCGDCHNTATLPTYHFTYIMSGRRPLQKGFAAATLGGGTTQISTYLYDSTTGTSTCAPSSAGCHGTKSWY